MKNAQQNILTKEEIQILHSNFKPVSYEEEAKVIYQGQIPFISLILVEGGAILVKKKNRIHLEPFSAIAFKEFYNKEAINYDVVIEKGSKVLAIDKSTLEEVFSDKIKNKLLSNLFSNIINNICA